MCGIFAVYNYQGDINAFRQRALFLSKNRGAQVYVPFNAWNRHSRIRHRGPDWSGCIVADNSILSHERLAIVGVDSGAQPLTNEDGTLVLSVNGEIYNHKHLRNNLKHDYNFKTHSDCEYEEHGADFINLLDGMFSFVLLDTKRNRVIAARDAIGITTLYYGWASTSPETVYFASELKALNEECDKILSFPPGHVYDSDSAEPKTRRWFEPTWWDESRIPTADVDYKHLRESLERAVRKRLMSEVPYGVLLSGGLDSSLIASIAARETEKIAQELKKKLQNGNGNGSPDEDDLIDESAPASWPRLHSFSVGLPGSPDLLAAREVAKHLRTIHHEYTFTVQEGLDAVADVVHHLETYDVTTIRASTPMYLLSRKIKAMGVKMVLSGEGADEILGGYLYFHYAPTPEELHKETVSRVKNLHTSDCLRANKSTMAWGLEARVPFLDKAFLEVAMNIDPRLKMSHKGRIEKYVLRKAFDTSDDPSARPYLPDKVLWRQKEQFSDGVGYSWIDSLKSSSLQVVSDAKFEKAAERWPLDTPLSKEAYWYREIFEQWFPQNACTESVVRWIPREDWGCSSDPSGRAQKIHEAAYEKPAEQ
ncbi:asparagine synthase [Jimgerdemannia flammicorona]|uniref:asparagine synthase (glutamine-hydrolyzing) n=1 Tax=Jimgerdemannia flammicorona TaxID=994334 RepID=A0A433QYU6_9FUNG|nr:asparagine synthase [Jimgerdemannia flammicorona]